MEDGDVVDLGDRAFEVIHVPGHSPGSIMLYDRRDQILFSGDTVHNGSRGIGRTICGTALTMISTARPASESATYQSKCAMPGITQVSTASDIARSCKSLSPGWSEQRTTNLIAAFQEEGTLAHLCINPEGIDAPNNYSHVIVARGAVWCSLPDSTRKIRAASLLVKVTWRNRRPKPSQIWA
ncbi:MBL fold metallo-hydrolase [Mesorhizobium atlanticum]